MSGSTSCLRASSRFTLARQAVSLVRLFNHRSPTVRPFFTSPSLSALTSKPTVLTASRTLPYPTYTIFKIIADIASYPQFLPYVRGAKIIEHSPRSDSHYNKTWPSLASLTVGFQENIAETYTSRVFCAPPGDTRGSAGVGFVEALAGSDAPEPAFTADEDVSHYDLSDGGSVPKDVSKGPLAYLRTRWTLRSYPHKPAPGSTEGTHATDMEPNIKSHEKTDVNLAVEFRFENPLYEMMGQAASGKVADKMIEAFEKRVDEVMSKEKQ